MFCRSLAFLLSTILFASASSHTLVPCRSGVTSGAFAVPEFNNDDGFVSGDLYQGDFLIVRYHWEGTLHRIKSPCLSCIEGTIEGTLDDGIGPGPDFVVRGRYVGNFFVGNGDFSARVFKTTGGAALGSIHGTFSDPPNDGAPGSFLGSWRICD